MADREIEVVETIQEVIGIDDKLKECDRGGGDVSTSKSVKGGTEGSGSSSKQVSKIDMGRAEDFREFSSGAKRDIAEGKGRCDLVPLEEIEELMKIEANLGKMGGSLVHDGSGVYLDVNTKEFKSTSHYIPGTTKRVSLYLNFMEKVQGMIAGREKEENSGLFYDRVMQALYIWITDVLCMSICEFYLEVSKHYEEGAKKYGDWNWQKGIPRRSYVDSALRHSFKYFDGWDDESHGIAAGWNLLCLGWTIKHID